MSASKYLRAMGTLDVASVFSTVLYVGNGGTQTITTGLDFAGGGGLNITKERASSTIGCLLSDTARGIQNYLRSYGPDAQTAGAGGTIASVSSNGYSLGSSSGWNQSGLNYVSHNFREASGFFDIVTFVGSGALQVVAHSLGAAPGMIAVKAVAASEDWTVAHRGTTNPFSDYLKFNGANAALNNSSGISAVGASSFSINGMTAGNTYVAYLFAHDTSSDGIIQCGSFTADGSGAATVSLGWEPQALEMKCISTAGNWIDLDTARGWGAGADKAISLNLTAAEATATDYGAPTSTGFTVANLSASQTYIYRAIRKAGA